MTKHDSKELAWQPPHVQPAESGEYRAALVPGEASPRVRRWWNGRQWSQPYYDNWSEAEKAQCRKNSDGFLPYWLPNNP